MKRKFGLFFILLLVFAATPTGQRIMLHQIPAWAIRDGGFKSSPDQVTQVGDLTGYFFEPAAGKPTLFFAHGNSSRHGRQIERLGPALDQGFGLYYITYPGFDQNLTRQTQGMLGWAPQLFSEAGGKQAFLDHWQAYLDLGGKPETTILAAESLGTTMMPWFSTQLTDDQRPPLMVLMAAFDEFANVPRSFTFGLVGRPLIYDDFNNTEIWPRVSIPTYVSNGGSDWLITSRLGAQITTKMGAPTHHEVVQGFGHLSLPLGEVILRAVRHDFSL